eukprot:TRINITY_DN12775_c0_g1_i1.p1 TRINITY_DN12775_c0_g1~~TRINITY_DN12775_c0_g1_i1.p1  ORF type:complete len:614 (+),score=136.46 TRINITY_DN12775_c0_g1_i1:144-1985(+)
MAGKLVRDATSLMRDGARSAVLASKSLRGSDVRKDKREREREEEEERALEAEADEVVETPRQHADGEAASLLRSSDGMTNPRRQRSRSVDLVERNSWDGTGKHDGKARKMQSTAGDVFGGDSDDEGVGAKVRSANPLSVTIPGSAPGSSVNLSDERLLPPKQKFGTLRKNTAPSDRIGRSPSLGGATSEPELNFLSLVKERGDDAQPLASFKCTVDNTLVLYNKHLEFSGLSISLYDIASVTKRGNHSVVLDVAGREVVFSHCRSRSRLISALKLAMENLPPAVTNVDASLLPAATSHDLADLFQDETIRAKCSSPQLFEPLGKGHKELFKYSFADLDLPSITHMLFSNDSQLERTALRNDSPPAENIEQSQWVASKDETYKTRTITFDKATSPSASSISMKQHIRVVSPTRVICHAISTITTPPFIMSNLDCHTLLVLEESAPGTVSLNITFEIVWTSPPSAALSFFGVDKKTLEGATAYWNVHFKKELVSALKQAGTLPQAASFNEDGEATDMSAFTEGPSRAIDRAGGGWTSMVSPMLEAENVGPLSIKLLLVLSLVLLFWCLLFIVYLWYNSAAWKAVAMELTEDHRYRLAAERVQRLEQVMDAMRTRV